MNIEQLQQETVDLEQEIERLILKFHKRNGMLIDSIQIWRRMVKGSPCQPSILSGITVKTSLGFGDIKEDAEIKISQ